MPCCCHGCRATRADRISIPNDRHILVLSGAWWVEGWTQLRSQRDRAPAGGQAVTHFAGGVHVDGANDEAATILVWGEGPATSTPFAAPPAK
jgi:hypothetical protein